MLDLPYLVVSITHMTWTAILEKPVSDRGTLEDLSQLPESSSGDRKLLILNGEMPEWSIRHAWKAMSWSDVETYRSTFSAAASAT